MVSREVNCCFSEAHPERGKNSMLMLYLLSCSHASEDWGEDGHSKKTLFFSQAALVLLTASRRLQGQTSKSGSASALLERSWTTCDFPWIIRLKTIKELIPRIL